MLYVLHVALAVLPFTVAVLTRPAVSAPGTAVIAVAVGLVSALVYAHTAAYLARRGY